MTEEAEKRNDQVISNARTNVSIRRNVACCTESQYWRCALISKGRIACRFSRATQTRKATPASVWRTRCVIRRQHRVLRTAPSVTRVHLLWVKRRRGGCSFLSAIWCTSAWLYFRLSRYRSDTLSFCSSLTFLRSHICLTDIQTRPPRHSSACKKSRRCNPDRLRWGRSHF